MIKVRRFADGDAPTLWALNNLPNIGATADPTVPLPLPPAASPPVNFSDLADIAGCFVRTGGDFVVAEQNDQSLGSAMIGTIRTLEGKSPAFLRPGPHGWPTFDLLTR